MTSIPANVQKYLAGGQTGQSKAQAADSRQDFSKVLDRQKTGTSGDNDAKATQQKQTRETNAASKQEQVSGQRDAKASEQPEGGQVQAEETAVQKDQTTEQPETSNQSETDQIMTETSVRQQPTEEPENLEQVMEVLQSAILQIQELLQQQLDITPEELQQTMQEKGIAEADLLQPQVVNQLVLDVAGAEDNLSLVMDENLYQSQQTINREFQEISQNLKKDLAESGEELPNVLDKLENSMSIRDVHQPDTTEENPQQSGSHERRETEHDRGQSRNVTGQVVYQNYSAQIQNPAAGQQISVMASAGESVYAEAQETRQIMNQVLDYMKVSLEPENTVLDMHLHPESLGTLHIQISAREGVMTAHFTASSEAVKIVLENQMAVLKENFLQQDIKVEAIEVTVQSHQFEENLEQGRQRNEEEAGRRPKRRKLDISSLEAGEELTESEQIITEMMAADGNTVDYLA